VITQIYFTQQVYLKAVSQTTEDARYKNNTRRYLVLRTV